MAEAAANTEGGTWTVMQQLGVQLVAVAIAIAYAAIAALIILVVVNKTVGLRSEVEDEMAGLDSSFHGERGYGMLNAS